MSASSTARRIAATALAAGAIVSAVALPAAAHDDDHRRAPKVEISRVQADSPGRDNRSNRSLNAEWVEITNNSRH
ncbi:lamin tail domain-containing protein, partial [Streptomyces sp. NPDC048350]